jgi:hypothetical protein
MAFKLSKEENNQRDELVAKLEIAGTDIDAAVILANATLETLLLPINEKIAAYNEILAEAKELVEDVAARMQDEFENKSEAWQEGEKGVAASAFITTWTDLDFEEVEEVEIELIEELDLAHRDDLENAPSEVGRSG